MQVLLGIRDFGKIKSAEVKLGGFSVFVGNNNSGKTYVMQLIYGIRKNLQNYWSDSDLCEKYLGHLEKQAETGKVIIDAGSKDLIEIFLNKVLEKYKEKIVMDTFYEDLEIGQIYVRLLMEEEEQFEWRIYTGSDVKDKLHEMLDIAQDEKLWLESLVKIKNFYCAIYKFQILNGERKILNVEYNLDKINIGLKVAQSAVELFADERKEMLFLPASRTGLLMLYKEFFAHKADESVKVLRIEDFAGRKSEPRRLGITQPVYDFLRFIQTFGQTGSNSENSDLIKFVEEHLIEGRVLISQMNQLVYLAQGAQKELPLYLSSSMINELMPVLYVLHSVRQKKTIIWDEIETSLHPQKQMELARLLSRMSNHGFSIIASTHSDTMAAKINNLCLLSFSRFLKGKRTEILKKAGLEEADLLKERIYVYQFENDESGRSAVKELEYDEMTGYQFSLFNDSVEKLFQETKMILE